jgi:general secretion pathway protein N
LTARRPAAGAPPQRTRSRVWLIVVLAIVAFLATLAMFLPASLISSALPPNVTTGALTGTVWQGAADTVTVAGRPVGNLQWRVQPVRLLSGQLAVDVELVRDTAQARAGLALATGQKLDVVNLTANWPLAELPIQAVPRGWTGDVEVAMPRLRFEKGAPVDLLGTVDLRGLQQNGADAGSFRVTFDENARQGEQLVGRFESLEGSLDVSGTITLAPGRNYVIDGLVAARPDAPRRMAEQLRYLGQPDAQGRRPFSVSGTY